MKVNNFRLNIPTWFGIVIAVICAGFNKLNSINIMTSFKLIIVLALVALTVSNFGWPPKKKKRKKNKTHIVEAQTGTNIGDIAPNIKLKNPSGKEMSLTDLRGQVVLIDFWASWCSPCRRENPNIVKAYIKYNKAKFKTAKGFEIFSVSLDKSVGPWKNAIVKDRLTWKFHVSDLLYWNSKAAALYHVNSIPMSFLIDENGKIIAKNLKGIGLHQALDKLVETL